jgi:hypothetical protein
MLKKNLAKDREIHKKDNIRIIRENVELIKEINRLRSDVKKNKGTAQPIQYAAMRAQRSTSQQQLPKGNLISVSGALTTRPALQNIAESNSRAPLPMLRTRSNTTLDRKLAPL